MSKLKQLIDKLCPNGVEYKTLGEIGKVCMCKRILKSETSTKGEIPFFKIGTFGKQPDAYITKEKYIEYKNKFSFPKKGDILISASGTIGRTVIYDGKPAYYQDSNIIWIDNDETIVLNKFLYYYYELKPWNIANGGTISRLYNTNLEKVKIPVPPLEVQNEIVRLLDRLTVATESIKGELSKEIVSQKKQYQYYRDLLLNFDNDINISDKSSAKRLIKELCPNGVEFTEIGEICKLVAGGDVPKDSYSEIKTEEYSVPIYSNGIGEKAVYGYTKIAKINEPCVTIAARGTIGYSAIRKEPFYPIIRLICAIPNDKITVSFLYYYLTTVKFHVPITGIPQLTIPMVKKYKVPLPPLEVQNKIVEILDRFNTLANDITCGLPAEIELQQKRYEYFRDLLLTFDDSLNDNAQGLKGSRAQGLKGSRAQGLKGSRAQGLKGSRAQGLKGSRARIVFWLRFGDTCTLKAGKSISANNISSEFDEENRYPCYGANGIRGYVSNFNEETTASIIGRQGALCGSVHYAEGKYYATEHAVVVKSKGFYLPRFLYYLLTVANLSQYKTAGAQPGLSVSKLENIMLPIPSLEEQQRIVNILDRFDKLCNDITCGLPAEIELHQKRYEYYRDKLLSFRELQTK